MHQTLVPVPPVEHRSRGRRVVVVVCGVVLAVLLAAATAVGVSLWSPARILGLPFAPNVQSGHIADGQSATLHDEHLPAIANLDPRLLTAMRDASAAAAADGLTLDVMSGWRSREYQQWLLEDAIESYGSEKIARQFVATPERSQHVTGKAIDVGPLDAQFWLIEHGAQWGLCQIYANERWHFEIATDPGGTCPELLADAEG